MRNKRYLVLMSLVAFVTFLAASCAINVKKYSMFMPEGMKECSLCHTLDEKGLPAERGSELVDSVEDMCIDCHTERIEIGEHPVGVVQVRKTVLPLFGGVVACMSCHEPHGKGGNVAMLRVPREVLCSACHNF